METRLLYIQNSVCTWCHEFGPVLAKIAERFGDEVPIDVYAGNSEGAGRSALALMTMKVLDASRAQAFAYRLQQAHFKDGVDLDADATYQALALEFDQDPVLFTNLMQHEQIVEAVQAEYDFVVSMGVTGFPTVIMTHGESGMVIAEGMTPYDDMEIRVELGRRTLGSAT